MPSHAQLPSVHMEALTTSMELLLAGKSRRPCLLNHGSLRVLTSDKKHATSRESAHTRAAGLTLPSGLPVPAQPAVLAASA
eukprot:1160890-Pelagomonas_calceolata.AAC.12